MPIMTLTIVLVVALLLIIGSSFTVALGAASIIVLLVFNPLPNMMIIPQLFAESSASFILLAVPLFILAGHLMEKGTIGEQLVDFASSIVGFMRGGLGNATIVGSMIFGGISGSSLADASIFTTLMVPRMQKDRYPKNYAAALVLASSSMDVIIPPSILMVMAAAATRQSVARCLIAGVLPGLIIGTAFVLTNIVISIRKGYGTTTPFSIMNVFRKLSKCITALIAPVIILGSIFSGIVTPTEAAAITVVYVLIIDFVIFRKITVKDIVDSIRQSAVATGTLLIIASVSSVISYLVAIENVPQLVGQWLAAVPGGRIGFYIALDIILLIIGMLLDTSPSIMIFCPLLMPIALSLGMDPIHFISTCVFGLALGLTTPPYGVCLFSVCNITRLPLDKLVKQTVPFYAVMFAVLVLVTFVPDLSLALSRLFRI